MAAVIAAEAHKMLGIRGEIGSPGIDHAARAPGQLSKAGTTTRFARSFEDEPQSLLDQIPELAPAQRRLRGMIVIFLFTLVREIGIYYFEMTSNTILIIEPARGGLDLLSAFGIFGSLPALAVHLWLPLFGFGLLCVNGLNYLILAIGGMQWFLKRGRDHPLDAVGYVLGFLVFVGTGILQLVR
jgi:hypothetical protein